ncbi:MAG TPA: SRPBCC family protein [Pyrinomonadaceae bacterium]|jgi:hypothetical protein
MATNEYHFITHWRVECTCREVSDILEAALDLPRWWPSVYLEVEELEPGDKKGLGRVIGLLTKGWLPYTLRWKFRVTVSNHPYGFTLRAFGDFEGVGVWTFEQDGEFVNMIYDWKIRADKPLLKALSFLLKPVFAANHRWAMARGLDSLKLELARRRALTPEEAEKIPPPPAPTFPHNFRHKKRRSIVSHA